MVLRIIRDGICRPNKFRRPNINALYSTQKSTSSNQPADDLARGMNCERTYDVTSHQFDDPHDLKRPAIFIAHTVIDTGKDGDKNSMTLLDSLKERLAAQPGFKHDLVIDEVSEKLEKDDPTAATDKQQDKFSKEDNAWQIVLNDSDITKDDLLHHRPRTIDEEQPVVDSPNLMPSHIRPRYHRQCEIQTNEMFDELARKYLTTERDQIDKHLAEDLERLGLPINTGEGISPSININISCEKEVLKETDVPKTGGTKAKGDINTNPQYYDQLSWCNLYFKEDGPTSEIDSSIEGVSEIRKVYDAKIAHTLHDTMLPLHCCLEFDPFEKGSEANLPEKLEFDEHLHVSQCMDFVQQDFKVNNNKFACDIDALTFDESLTIHHYLQGNLIDDVTIASQPVAATNEIYELIAPFEEIDNTATEPVTDTFHNLMIQDMDVTKFDYTFPREYSSDLSAFFNQSQSFSFQTMEGNSKSTQESNAIIQIEARTVPNTEVNQKTDLSEDSKQAIKNIIKTKPPEQMDATEKEQTKEKTNQTVLTTENNQKSELLERLTSTNLVKTKVAEQVDVTRKEEKALTVTNDKITKTKIDQKADFVESFQDVKKINLLEQKGVSQKLQDAMDTVSHQIGQTKPSEVPKTEADIRNLINAKVMEQIGARNTTVQPQPHGRLDNLVQMNPQALPKPQPLMNIIHAKVLEQMGAQNTLQGATPTVTNMQPQKTTNTDWENIQKSVPSSKQAQTMEQPKQPSRETETIVQSCVQAVPGNEAKIAQEHDSIPKGLDAAVDKLSLDMNLSLSELLRRVRTRNRLKYMQEIRSQVQNMSIVTSEKRCPPSTRPQCPPPPDCSKPCPPPPKKKCPPEPPKCPPDPPKCPPDPPKCPPEPPKCPPPKAPKCPPDPPKCPPDPPKCPPEPKCPCPCPPPPKCPPEPPKCPCQVIHPDDPVTLEPSLGQSLLWSYLRNVMGLIKIRLLEPRNMLSPKEDPKLEIVSLKLNRVRDFEPWTPIPSWPFPVEYKKRKLQCPYHGCPMPKPGPVRPNCPELPCTGFPKRLCFSNTTQ